jgi:prophage DNA circulation protein
MDWDALFIASYAGLTLHVVETDDDMSRLVARYKYPRRDGANTEDLGQDARETAATIVWFGVGHLQRLATFAKIVSKGQVETLVHPITGSYQARVEGFRFTARAESRDWIVSSCRFIEASTDIAAFEVAEGQAGVEAVEVAASELDLAIAAHGAEPADPGLAAAALATVQRWADAADLASTRIALELGGITARIDAAMNTLEVATNPNAYPVYEAFVNLHRRVGRAADVAVSRSPRLTRHIVATGAPLLAICQDLYGGAEAEAAFGRILRLNQLRTPAHVPAGTVLVVEEA